MPFSERVRGKADAPLQCVICRQLVQDGRQLLNPEYQCSGTICKSCYRSFYMDKKAGLDAGIADDTDRTAVRYRRSEPLEHDPIFRRSEPACGYEFPFPDSPVSQIVRDTLFWVLFCVGSRLLLLLLAGFDSVGDWTEHSLSAGILDLLLPAGSLLWGMHCLYRLVQGLLYGMGYTRQLVLAAAMIVQVLLAWLCRTGMLFW